MKFWNGMGAGLGAIALTMAAFGQPPTTTTPPATCTTPPTSLTAFNVERILSLSNILSTLTPNVPASTLAAIAGGALEVHELLVYNPQLGTITSTTFAMAAGAPVPTPLSGITPGNTVQVVTIKISQILFGCSPVPSVLFVGNASAANGVYGPVNGAPAAISIGYTTDNPPKINNVTEVLAGVAVAYSPAGTGTVTFTSTAVTPPGTSGGVNIIVNTGPGTTSIPANSVVQAPSSPFFLDATKSTGNGALTFTWSTTSNSPVAFIGTPTPGQIEVQFPSAGDYAILLTVTDSTGAKSTFPLTLTFTGRPQ